MEKEKTVIEMLYDHVMRTPERTCLIYDPETRLSFSDLWCLTGRIYGWLKKRGIGKEKKVLYFLERGPGLFAAMAGTMRAGAAFILTETGNNEKRTSFIRKNCEPDVVVTQKEWAEIIATEPLDGWEKTDSHDLLYIAYTSGTTADPKGVLHEYGSLENAWKSARVDNKSILTASDTFLAMSPLNFVSQPIMFSFLCAYGTSLALMPYSYRESDEKFYSYLSLAGVNSGYLTPSFLRKHYPFREKWRMCILSSEPADGLFIDGMKVYNCYASTESGCLTTVYEMRKAETPSPVGRSGSGLDVFVLDEEGREAGTGETGEVCWRNPFVRGYLNLPEKTRRLLRGRIFHSGDAGEIREDGSLVLHGRIDEMFKIGGYRIEPEEVASAVKKVTGLEHIVVRGFVLKDISAIIVFYTDKKEIDEEKSRKELLEVLPEYMVPTSFVHLEDFPLLSTGKLDKLSLLPPEGSWDGFRRLKGADFKVIGKGRTATVYDMGDKVLKLFKPEVPYTLINQEKILTSVAHEYGITCENAYEIVRSGASYGIILDKLEGDCLEDLLMVSGEKKCDSVMEIFAAAVKKMHSLRVTDERLPDMKEYSISLCDFISPSLCNREEKSKIRAIFEAIPDCDTFALGDCHPGNAMIKGEEISFIDFMFSGKGHPVFDLLSIYSGHIFRKDGGVGNISTDRDRLFSVFMKVYAPDLRGEEIGKMKRQMDGIRAARILIASAALPGFYPGNLLEKAKKTALSFSEKYCSGGRKNTFSLDIPPFDGLVCS